MSEMVTETIVITDRDKTDDAAHIPFPSSIDGGGFQTLCGWCDVNHDTFEYDERPANCSQCIDVWKAIKGLRFPRGYFAKSSQKKVRGEK